MFLVTRAMMGRAADSSTAKKSTLSPPPPHLAAHICLMRRHDSRVTAIGLLSCSTNRAGRAMLEGQTKQFALASMCTSRVYKFSIPSLFVFYCIEVQEVARSIA